MVKKYKIKKYLLITQAPTSLTDVWGGKYPSQAGAKILVKYSAQVRAMMAIDDGRNKNMDTHANRKAGMGFHQEWSFALPGAKPSRK